MILEVAYHSTPIASAIWNAEGAWIVATAAVTNAACALVGCFLVLRRMSLMGDALSHAVLPGLALAFILSGSYSIGPLMVGAVAAGLLTAFLTQTLHHYVRIPGDASMGVVFTSLFAIGVVLINRGIQGVHFDVKCVYEGQLEFAPLYVWEFLGYDVPRALIVAGGVLLLNFAVIILLWKEFKLSSFDPALATTMGYPAALLHYLLMALVAMTAVASFEAVGAILVVAMLIIPPATAYLLVDRLATMVATAVAVAVAAAVLGYLMAGALEANFGTGANIAGMTTVAAALLFALAALFSPRHGVVSAAVRNVQTSLRVVREDILAMLFRIEELPGARRLATAEARRAVGGGPLAGMALRALSREGRVAVDGDGLALTSAGRDDARRLVRSHRLWETYLVRELGMPLDHVHEPAHRVEHFIGDKLREQLQAELPRSGTDPHGREIPS
jgi:manganese/zinc/iron transport system permease protein